MSAEPPTTEQVDAFLHAVRAGSYPEVAAAHAGAELEALLAVEGIGPRIEAARASAEVRAVAVIMQAATEQWQAAAWMLERRAPQRWAKVTARPEPEQGADDADLVDELAAKRAARRQAAL